jgi:hypothetical protein
MQEPKPLRRTGPSSASVDERAPERELLDRSYLLRRERRYPFPGLLPEPDSIRFRRSRRVSGSFRGIAPLSRNGRI